jgi:RNA polymerase sigma-70 factor (family 1)
MFCKIKSEPKIYFTSGDPKKFTETFTLFYAKLCFFANRIVKDPQAAEDVVVDVFLKLWIIQGNFETVTNVKAWLYLTTRNSCFNYCKQTSKVCYGEIEPNSIYSDETVLTGITRAEILQEIMNMIENLPIECRRIFKLSYFDDLTNGEIAEMLSLSIHTVKNQKARGVYLIRKRLKYLIV